MKRINIYLSELMLARLSAAKDATGLAAAQAYRDFALMNHGAFVHPSVAITPEI
jgi:hypothetical protein